jgi:hypothetical protein
MICSPVYADSVGLRGAVADFQADEEFEVYELFVVFDLPWAWNQGETVIQTQLELTGGMMDAADQSGFLGTLGPRLAIQSGTVTLDLGVGVAALGETEFGETDFGGSSQFIAQAGLSVAVLERFNLGLRVRHMSDAEIHDGEDLNLILVEASYDFNE